MVKLRGMATQLIRSAAHQLASRVDRAFVEAVITPSARARRRDPAERLPHDKRLERLKAVQAFYGQPEFFEEGSDFFSHPGEIEPATRVVRKLGRKGEVVDLSWDSHFSPLWERRDVAAGLDRLVNEGSVSDEDAALFQRILAEVEDPKKGFGPFREKYLAVHRNRTAHARWFRHNDGPRPAVVLIHGHMGGFMPMEERLWPVAKLFNGGMDVVLPMLPLHGKRRDPKRGLRPPDFPSSDPRRTIEGFRQLVHDFNGLADYLLDGRVSSLGVGGMSLGGHAAGLIATLEERLSFAMMLVPLACIADFAHHNGRLVGGTVEQAQQALALREAQRVISPIARAPKIRGKKVLVVEGRADRVTGPQHANRLAVHFDARATGFDGGHLLQFGRAEAFEPMWRLLRREGLWQDN